MNKYEGISSDTPYEDVYRLYTTISSLFVRVALALISTPVASKICLKKLSGLPF